MRSHWIATTMLLGAVFCAALAPQAAAQIAAPSIAPGSFTSDNPAAIKWGAPSKFGLGAVGMQRAELPDGEAYNSVGGAVGIRLVGESFAFASQLLHTGDQADSLTDTRDWGSASFALQTGSSLAWGLGYSFQKQDADSAENSSREQTLGISIRLGEVWFLGVVIGREAVYSEAKDPTFISYYGERETSRYGLGFRRGGTVLVHAELFGYHKDPIDSNSSFLGKFDGEDATGATLEFTFWSFLIGATATHSVHKESFIDKVDVLSADVGYAPRQGLAITVHHETTEWTIKDPLPGSVESTKDTLTALVFTWQF